MATEGTKINDALPKVNLSGAEEYPVNDGGNDRKVSTDSIADYSINKQFNKPTKETLDNNDKFSVNGSNVVLWSKLKELLQGIISLFNFVDFNPAATPPAHQAGRLYFDSVEDALTYYNSESDISLQIGRELWVRVKNNTGQTILNCTNVYISTADITSKLPAIGVADCCTYEKSRIIGKATHDIENDTIGYVAFFGVVRDCNTSSFNAGDTLYLTSTGGDKNTFPVGGEYTTRIGTVLESAVNGSVQLNISTSEYTVETLQQTGWPDVANLNITFDDLTRTLTVAPLDGISVRFYEKGIKRLVEGAGDSFQIADTTGLHFIYYSNGVITETINPTIDQEASILANNPVIRTIYWRQGDRQIYMGVQTHNSISYGSRQIALDHLKGGAQYVSNSGLGLTDFTIVTNASLPAHAQFAIQSGKIVDSDILTTTPLFSATTGVEIAYIEAGGVWQRAVNAGYSFLNTGTGRVAYSNPAGGLLEAPDNTYVLYHLFANNDQANNRRVLSVPGLAAHSSVVDAEAAADEEAATILAAAPVQEFVLIGIVIFQTRNSYTNAVKAKVSQTSDGDNYIDKRSSGLVSSGGGSTPLKVFADNEFKIYDDITLFELSNTLDNLTQNINITWQDKSITVAGLDDLANLTLSQDTTIVVPDTYTHAQIVTLLENIPDDLGGHTLTLDYQGNTYTSSVDDYIGLSRFTDGIVKIISTTSFPVITINNNTTTATLLNKSGSFTLDVTDVTFNIVGTTGGVGLLTDIENKLRFKTSEFKIDNLALTTTQNVSIIKANDVNFNECTFHGTTNVNVGSSRILKEGNYIRASFMDSANGVNKFDYLHYGGIDYSGRIDIAEGSTFVTDFFETTTAIILTDGGSIENVNLLSQFDTSTTAADPGAGKFRLNNATQGSATELYISDTEYDNGNIGDFLNALSVDSVIGLKNIGNRAKWVNYKVVSVTNNTGWWTVVMSVENKGTDFTLNDIVGVSLLGVGGGVSFGNMTKEEVAFSQSVSFIKDKLVTTPTPYSQSTPLFFTPDYVNAVNGATNTYVIDGDDTNSADLSLFTKWDPVSGLDFDNTKRNSIIFYYDGVTPFYSIAHTEKSDIIAPLYQSSEIGLLSDDTIVMQYNEGLDNTKIPDTTDFAVTADAIGQTISSVSVSGASVQVVLSTPVNAGQSILLSYTQNALDSKKLQDVAGNFAANLTNEVVTNNISAAITITDITPSDLVNILVDGGNNLQKDSNATVAFNASAASTESISNASTDAWYEFTPRMVTQQYQALYGMSNVPTGQAIADMEWGFGFIDNGVIRAYSSGSFDTLVQTWTDNERYRVRIQNANTPSPDITLERFNGSAWDLLYTYTTPSPTLPLRFHALMNKDTNTTNGPRVENVRIATDQ